jgi:hypothetical protein
MGHGGKREGAGRKPGAVSQRSRDIAEAIVSDGGITPLEYLMGIVRDKLADDAKRIDAAKAAAPYVHAKLNAIDGTLNLNATIEEVRHRIIDSASD